jgi:hypothetical protein
VALSREIRRNREEDDTRPDRGEQDPTHVRRRYRLSANLRQRRG